MNHEYERLAIRQADLDVMSQVISEASHIKYDVLTFENLVDESLYLSTTETEFDMSSDDNFLVKYRDYTVCKKHELQPMLYGILISKHNLMIKKYFAYSFFHKTNRYSTNTSIHIRKSGIYAVLYHKGDTPSHVKIYNNILNEIERKKLKIISPMYVYDLMSNLINQTTGEYTTKYCVRVR